MRAILNAILSFIGSTSLTDNEYDSLEIEDTSDDLANYEALLAVLDSREDVSTQKERLEQYYLAKGVAVSEPVVAKSNILVGGEL